MLQEWKTIHKNHFENIVNLLREIKFIGKEYSKSKENVSEIGFNPFTIASDLYYRENFHSDIIKALLDPQEKHKEGYKYLHLFIELLNKTSPINLIDKDNYRAVEVIRERHNIDILITDKNSKRAIIIENKINNAGDMHRQLPRYYNLIKKDYTVDAIVYITLNASKHPETNDWSKDELKDIKDLLKIIPSYSRHEKCNLYEGWLLSSMMKSNNIDSSYLLRQYADLIKYLNTNYMDTISLEKFYESLKENDNLKTSISIRNMLNDLPEYLAIRVEDKYKDT